MGVCPSGCMCPGGYLPRSGVSVYRRVCVQVFRRISVQRCICLRGDVCPGGMCPGTCVSGGLAVYTSRPLVDRILHIHL